MPYQWTDAGDETATLTLRPHRSLPARGFVWVIGLTTLGLALPLVAVVGSPVLWGLLPFAALAVWALWAAIARTNRTPTETLTLGPDRLTLTHDAPGRAPARFEANPHWVRVEIRPGPVEAYLTLSVQGREVELGRFLTAPERRALDAELRARLRVLKP